MGFGTAENQPYTHSPHPGQAGYRSGYEDTTGSDYDPGQLSAPRTGDHDRDVALAYAEQQAKAAHDAVAQGGFASRDAGIGAYQDQAAQAIGQRAFGGPTAGYGSALTAALTSPYAAQTGPRSAALGQSLASELTTQGQQGAQGAANALGVAQHENQGRLGAVSDYAQQAALQRRGDEQLAEFNATQQGDINSKLYSALYQQAKLGQQSGDQKNAQNAQTGVQIATSLLPLILAAA